MQDKSSAFRPVARAGQKFPGGRKHPAFALLKCNMLVTSSTLHAEFLQLLATLVSMQWKKLPRLDHMIVRDEFRARRDERDSECSVRCGVSARTVLTVLIPPAFWVTWINNWSQVCVTPGMENVWVNQRGHFVKRWLSCA